MGYKTPVIRNPNLSGKGYGRPGYCLICDALNTRPELRKQANAVFVNSKAPAITAWLDQNLGMKPDRRTVYAHKGTKSLPGHVQNPKDRLVSQVAAQRAKGTLPASVSEDQYLDAVLAAAMARVVEEPESVTIDQGLKAAAAKTAAKQSRAGAQITLQFALTQPLTTVPTLLVGDGSIEGDYSELVERDTFDKPIPNP